MDHVIKRTEISYRKQFLSDDEKGRNSEIEPFIRLSYLLFGIKAAQNS